MQPFFDGKEATIAGSGKITSLPFVGSDLEDLEDPGNWATAIVDLAPRPGFEQFDVVGAIAILGEPTKAVVDGQTQLFFVYVQRMSDSYLDLNAGWVPME